MAEIIAWTDYESKRIEFDKCKSAGPLFGIGVFTSTATNQLATARATAQDINSSRWKSGKISQNWFVHVDLILLRKIRTPILLLKYKPVILQAIVQ